MGAWFQIDLCMLLRVEEAVVDAYTTSEEESDRTHSSLEVPLGMFQAAHSQGYRDGMHEGRWRGGNQGRGSKGEGVGVGKMSWDDWGRENEKDD